jgi:hypothetical protein
MLTSPMSLRFKAYLDLMALHNRLPDPSDLHGSGGRTATATYQINVGGDISFVDFGWGTGTWGLSTWGTPRPASTGLSLLARVWQFDNFGQILILQAG